MSERRYGCQGCCGFPNGRLAIFAMLTSLIGYAMVGTGNWGCRYMKVTDNQGLIVTDGTRYGLGLWQREDVFNEEEDYDCTSWTTSLNDAVADSTWNAARSMASLAGACGLFLVISTIVSSCVGLRACFIKILALFALLAGLFASLVFIAFASEVCDPDVAFDCQFNTDAGIAIGGICLWIITSFILMKVPEPPEVDYPPPQMSGGGGGTAMPVPGSVAPPPGTVTVTEDHLPDGTKKIIRTTYNADGSKTVQETIETPNTSVPMASVKTY